jgi:hypothetical protein
MRDEGHGQYRILYNKELHDFISLHMSPSAVKRVEIMKLRPGMQIG